MAKTQIIFCWKAESYLQELNRKKFIFLKRYSRQVIYSFENPAAIFFAKRLKSFCSKLEYTLTKILWKKIFQEISFWQVKYCLDKPAGNFLAK